jgi:hypothetical protein
MLDNFTITAHIHLLDAENGSTITGEATKFVEPEILEDPCSYPLEDVLARL